MTFFGAVLNTTMNLQVPYRRIICCLDERQSDNQGRFCTVVVAIKVHQNWLTGLRPSSVRWSPLIAPHTQLCAHVCAHALDSCEGLLKQRDPVAVNYGLNFQVILNRATTTYINCNFNALS